MAKSKKKRLAPTQSATLYKLGTRKRGNDDNMWSIVKNKNGVKRWKKTTKTSRKSRSRKTSRKSRKTRSRKVRSRKTRSRKVRSMRERRESFWGKKVRQRQKELSGMKSTKTFISKSKLTTRDRKYNIHDNGGRPYLIIANNKGIFVYTYVNKAYDKFTVLLRKFTKFLGYWSGFDSSPYKFHGNSILIQVTKKEYVFIGESIYSFKTTDIITDYVSPVGNSDVPYPIAYGEDYMYFMLERKYVKKQQFETPITVKNAEDLYGEFYGHIHPEKNKRKIKIKGVKNLEKRRIDVKIKN